MFDVFIVWTIPGTPLVPYDSFAAYINRIRERSLPSYVASDSIDVFTELCNDLVDNCEFDNTSNSCDGTHVEDPHVIFRQWLLVWGAWIVLQETFRAALVVFALQYSIPFSLTSHPTSLHTSRSHSSKFHPFVVMERSPLIPVLGILDMQLLEQIMLLEYSSRNACCIIVFETLLRSIPCLWVQIFCAMRVVQTDFDWIMVLNILFSIALALNEVRTMLSLF